MLHVLHAVADLVCISLLRTLKVHMLQQTVSHPCKSLPVSMSFLPNAQSRTDYSSTSPSRPENCPEEYYTLIQNCLSHEASDRPTFANITALLGAYSNEEFRLEEVERNEMEDTIRCTTTNLSPVEEVPESWTLVTTTNNNNNGEYSNDTQGSEEDWCQESDIDYQINGGACAAGGRKGSIVTAGSSQDSLTPSTHASRISLVWLHNYLLFCDKHWTCMS